MCERGVESGGEGVPSSSGRLSLSTYSLAVGAPLKKGARGGGEAGGTVDTQNYCKRAGSHVYNCCEEVHALEAWLRVLARSNTIMS